VTNIKGSLWCQFRLIFLDLKHTKQYIFCKEW